MLDEHVVRWRCECPLGSRSRLPMPCSSPIPGPLPTLHSYPYPAHLFRGGAWTRVVGEELVKGAVELLATDRSVRAGGRLWC